MIIFDIFGSSVIKCFSNSFKIDVDVYGIIPSGADKYGNLTGLIITKLN